MTLQGILQLFPEIEIPTADIRFEQRAKELLQFYQDEYGKSYLQRRDEIVRQLRFLAVSLSSPILTRV